MIKEFERTKQDNRVYNSRQILEYVSRQQPLLLTDVDKFSLPAGIYEPSYNHMNSYEARFAKYLITLNLKVYREIPISDSGSTADFYVYNPKSGAGKLVEVTLIYDNPPEGSKVPSLKTRRRKRRQLDVLKNTGVPFVVLYKENLENIRQYKIADLF